MSEGKQTAWALPVHRSLIKPVYWMGVPRGLLVMEFFFMVLGAILLKTFLIIPLIIVVHLFFQHVGETDSVFYKVLIRALRHNGFYGN